MTPMQHPSLYGNAVRLRWLGPKEILAVSNYLAQAGRSAMSGESAFAGCREDYNLPKMRRIPLIDQAGNGMHVCIVDMALQWVWVM